MIRELHSGFSDILLALKHRYLCVYIKLYLYMSSFLYYSFRKILKWIIKLISMSKDYCKCYPSKMHIPLNPQESTPGTVGRKFSSFRIFLFQSFKCQPLPTPMDTQSCVSRHSYFVAIATIAISNKILNSLILLTL